MLNYIYILSTSQTNMLDKIILNFSYSWKLKLGRHSSPWGKKQFRTAPECVFRIMCAELDNFISSEYVLVGQFVENQHCSLPPEGDSVRYPHDAVACQPLPINQQCFGQVCHESVASANQTATNKIRPNGLLAKLALPCQTQPNYDYDQCYSFYANGCYNTCQFVETGDIEDFM